jgi:nicotinate-nucleotide adenylyltransferase
VLGGAFNPPHIGHLVLAREAVARLGLERALLVPTGIAPHKEIAADPGAEVRLELARRAVEGDDLIEVEPFEVEQARHKQEPSFMYRTLEALTDRMPGVDLVLLMGCDAAVGLPSWREPRRVLELASLGVAPRGGIGLGEATESVRAVSEDAAVEAVDMPAVAISSSLLRERVRSGLPIHYLVPAGAERVIRDRGLYK